MGILSLSRSVRRLRFSCPLTANMPAATNILRRAPIPIRPAFYFYREVPLAERDALKKEDRRRLQIDRVLTEKNAAVLRDAVVTFLVGGAIRRLQQQAAGQ